MDAFHGSLLTENGEQHDDTQRTVGYPEIWQMAPAGAGPDLYGRHLQSAICLTLLTKPLSAKLGVGLPELQVTFSLLIILQTFFSPFSGAVSGKICPRRLIAIGTVMAGMSWVLSAQVNGLATSGWFRLHGRPRDRNILIINGAKKFGHSNGQLNDTLTEVATVSCATSGMMLKSYAQTAIMT